MTNKKVPLYFAYALKTVLYLILITPILISSKYLFPFITTKTIYFRLMVEIALVLYLILLFITNEFKPKMNKLSWSVVIFGGVIFLTGITGMDFYRTFWGTIERGEGFLTISHLMIYFLLLTWVFKSKKDWLNYISALIGVGLMVDLYAILQKAQVENFFLFGRVINSGGRLTATLGNAAFLGAFTLAQFFLSLLIVLKRNHWGWKILGASGALINLYVLFQTQTRGAGIALAIVLIIGSLFFALKIREKKLKFMALGFFILIIASIILIFTFKNSSLVQNNPMLYRLVSISKTDITTESRLLAWDTSWKGWQDRFIFGYGWENYNIAFNKYFHAEIFKDAGSQLWFDRAHNTIFDVAVATGLIGLINYLTIFGLALYYLYKKLAKDFYLSFILMCSLVAHFIQNIFVFDVLSTYVILYTVLALITFINFEEEENPNKNNPKKDFNIILLIGLILIITFLAYIFNCKPLQANKIGIQALSLAGSDEKQTVKLFEEGIALNTYQTMELRQKLADNILAVNRTKNGLTQDDVNNNYQISIKEIKKNIEEHPNDVQNHLYLMALNNQYGSSNKQAYGEVLIWGEKALRLSPTRPQIYFEMGQASINLGNFTDGITYFKKALALNEEAQESHWNLFAAYSLIKKNELADAEIKWLENNGFDFTSSQNLNRLYTIYMLSDRKEKMVETLEKLIDLEPNADNYAKIAAAYKEVGQFDKARAAVNKAVELNPELQAEAVKFLQLLK
ncbi:MAG TPA: O-antigen ligase family protein [bacterium]|nr:O-antigen ligase family protein [bacterium]